MVLGFTHKPQCHRADNVHEDVSTFAEDCCIEGHKWLRAAKGEERVCVRLVKDNIRTRNPSSNKDSDDSRHRTGTE